MARKSTKTESKQTSNTTTNADTTVQTSIEVKTESKPAYRVEGKRSSQQGNWKRNRLVQAMTEAILDIVDELTFTDDGHLVGPTPKEILRELPPGVSLSEVEGHLAVLTEVGLLGMDECGCGDCGSRIYFRICGDGVPLILHDNASILTVH